MRDDSRSTDKVETGCSSPSQKFEGTSFLLALQLA